MIRIFVVVVCLAALAACARPVRPQSAATVAPPPPTPVLPFDDEPQSFVVRGSRFAGGEVAVVKVCIGTDHSVVSANVVESSGDRRFDDLAVVWAQRIRIKSQFDKDVPVDRCGEVRVEIKKSSAPHLAGPDTALG